MKTRTLLTIPIVGLLVLAGVFSNAPPALADCPLPPGVTPPADPRVTAQQVEDGSATVEEFALAVRERSREYAQGASDRGTSGIYRMHHKAGRWDLAFRFHVHRKPDPRR
jgi:hypothetical protein